MDKIETDVQSEDVCVLSLKSETDDHYNMITSTISYGPYVKMEQSETVFSQNMR